LSRSHSEEERENWWQHGGRRGLILSKYTLPSRAPKRIALFAGLAGLAGLAVVLALLIPALAASRASSAQQSYVTIYPSKTVPATPAGIDPRAVELGVRFAVSTPGSVVALRYYKGPENDGAHIGSLWNASGAALAHATFRNESRSGWQVVFFNKSVALVPHHYYVASYHTSTGHYAQQQWAFADNRSLGNTTITASEGLFAYGTGAFPTSTWHNAAYYVDVLFKPSGGHYATPPAGSTSSAPPRSSAPRSTLPTSTRGTPTAPSTSSAHGSSSPAPPTSFPGPSNTGVPADTHLMVHSGDMTINQDGYVLENTEVDGCITVNANNVAIRNVLVKADSCYWLIRSEAGPVTITNVEIDGENNPVNDAGIACSNCTLTRVNIHNTIDGMKADYNVTVQDSFIHDLYHTSTSHSDGIQSLGTTHLTIKHNTIIVSSDANSAIILSTGSATDMRNVSIADNLLGGGGYTVYAGYAAGSDQLSKVSNISVTGNEFTIVSFPKYAKSGWYASLGADDPPVVVSGNIWADGPNAGRQVNR
jgi:hypothetical protein